MNIEYTERIGTPPIKIRLPKDIDLFVDSELTQYVIYDRWRKVAHCTCCGHTWKYKKVIRKHDRVRCPKCRKHHIAEPHTAKYVGTQYRFFLMWSYRNSIRFGILYAYWKYDGKAPEETSNTAIAYIEQCGEIKTKDSTNYVESWDYKKGWTYRKAKDIYCGYKGSHIRIHRSIYKELDKSFMSGRLPSWMSYDPDKLIKTIAFYAKHPQTEYLEKADTDLYKIAQYRIYGRPTYIWPNWRAKKLHTFLGVSAQDIDKMKAWGCFDTHGIAMYKQLRKYKKNPKKEQLRILCDWFEDPSCFRNTYSAFYGMNFYKIALYLERQSHGGADDDSWRLRGHYADYLRQLRYLEYPEDDYYLYPKDLGEAHDRISEEYRERTRMEQEEAEKKKIAALQKEQEEFESKILPALEQLAYTDGIYSIYPLRCHQDFLDEGRHQHNCVASYYERAIKGKTRIFVMRLTEDIGASLVTIELSTDNKQLKQVYAKGNAIPSPELKAKVEWWHKNIVLKNKKARKSA